MRDIIATSETENVAAELQDCLGNCCRFIEVLRDSNSLPIFSYVLSQETAVKPLILFYTNSVEDRSGRL